MVFLKRVFLFILTNILVIATLNILMTVLTRFFGIPIHPGTYTGLLFFSAIMGAGGAFISLFLSKYMAKWSMGVQIIDPQTSNPQDRALVNLVHRLAQKAGLPAMPEVGIYESPDINAFATGPSKSSSLVAVSTGLLNRMNQDEIEGVLGHEVAHIANGDMVTLTLIQGIVNTFTIFLARVLSGLLSEQVEEKNRLMVRWIMTQLFDVLFAVLGSIVVNYFSRQREFRADAGSAKVTSREKMTAALRKLQLVYEGPMNIDGEAEENKGLNAFKISNRSKSGFMKLFSTHPPLEERIAHLQHLNVHRL
jgi:heat shock protein HtpX